MLELVTTEDARAQLRLDEVDSDGGADDSWLGIFIPAISYAVALWLKDSWRLYLPELDSDGEPVLDSDGNPTPLVDSNGNFVVHPTVRAAVLIELAYQFRFREGDGEGIATGDLYSGRYGYILNKTATAILGALRKPTVA